MTMYKRHQKAKKRKVRALSSSSAEPSGLGDPSPRLVQALRRRDEMIWESLPWIPTLKQVMEAYEGLPMLMMTEEECVDHMIRLT